MTHYVETLSGQYVLFTGKVSDGYRYEKREQVQKRARDRGAVVLPDRNQNMTLLVLGDYNPGAPKYTAEDLGKKAMFAIDLIRSGRQVDIVSAGGVFDLANGKPARSITESVLARLG